MARVRGIPPEKCLLVPIDVGKHSAVSLVADHEGRVVHDPITFPMAVTGTRTLVSAAGAAERAMTAHHLEARQFSPGTVRSYAFDLLCLVRFFADAGIDWREATPTDFFDWLEWPCRPAATKGQTVVRLAAGRGAAPATMNRRVAAARGLFEHAVVCGVLDRNPVPAPRRSSGLRGARRGLLGHVTGRRAGVPARLVRQPRGLPESLDADDVAVFLADLGSHRDRAIVLLMLLGGVRSRDVRSLRLAVSMSVCGR